MKTKKIPKENRQLIEIEVITPYRARRIVAIEIFFNHKILMTLIDYIDLLWMYLS